MVKDPTERFRLDKAFRAYVANRTEEGFDAFLNEFADCIRQGRHAMVPAELADAALLKEAVDKALSTLTPREKRVLVLRYGLEDGRNRTLEQVGAEFDVTRERIRQIEAKAIRKLRHPARGKGLEDFLKN